jgi:hypothetical protein
VRLTSPVAQNGGGRAMVARHHKLPWIPNDEDWHCILSAARQEPIRNRIMLAFAYDAGLRREELCGLRSEDIDPSRRTLRIRAESTKGRRERIVPYSASSGELLLHYLERRRSLGQKRGPLFLSESRRNYAQPVSNDFRPTPCVIFVSPTWPARIGTFTRSQPSPAIAVCKPHCSTSISAVATCRSSSGPEWP